MRLNTTPAYKEVAVGMQVLAEVGPNPLPRISPCFGHPTPQRGVEVEHDRTALDLVRGSLGAGDKLVETLVYASKTAEACGGIRNMLVPAWIMSTLEPGLLEGFFVAFREALTTTKVEAGPPSLFHILNQFRSLQMWRALMLANRLSAAFVRNLPVEKCS